MSLKWARPSPEAPQTLVELDLRGLPDHQVVEQLSSAVLLKLLPEAPPHAWQETSDSDICRWCGRERWQTLEAERCYPPYASSVDVVLPLLEDKWSRCSDGHVWYKGNGVRNPKRPDDYLPATACSMAFWPDGRRKPFAWQCCEVLLIHAGVKVIW